MKLKMKCSLVFVFLVCLRLLLISQNAYYDALKCTGFDNSKIDFIKEKINTGGMFNEKEKEKIENFISFIGDPISFVKQKGKESLSLDIISILKDRLKIKGRQPLEQELPTFEPSRAASLSYKSFQRNIIDAVGTLIAERLKEDIANIYLNKFKTKLKKIKGYDQLKLILPKTTDLINKNDPFSYFSLGIEWKAAFKKDLETLPENMLECLKQLKGEFPDLIGEDLYNYFILAIDISNKLMHGYHPVYIIEYQDIKFQNLKRNIYYQILHTFNLFQKNLQRIDKIVKNGDEEESAGNEDIKNDFSGWISYTDLKNLLVKPKGLEYFLALVYLQDKNFFVDSGIGEQMMSIERFKDEYIEPCLDILYKINALNEKISISNEDYLSYMELMMYLFRDTYRFIQPEKNEENLEGILRIIQQTFDIYRAIYQKNYFLIIGNVFAIMEEIAPELKKPNEPVCSNINDPDCKKKTILNKFRSVKVIKQFSTFIEGIAAAQNADQMKAVISAVTLPHGGFMTTRTAKRTLSITAHPGFYLGKERLNPEGEGIARGAKVFGFTAPIGLEHCWGIKGTSLGVFVSVFDLGAVVSYRFPQKEDKYRGLPDDISLKQIFSPGVSLNIGIKNSPLTLGIGYQYTPELRRIIEETNDENDIITKSETKANAGRIFLRLSWSMPFVHISRKN